MVSIVALLAGRPLRRSDAGRRNGRIAFQAHAGAHRQVFTINPDGSGLRQVTRLAGAEQPDWSPDGEPDRVRRSRGRRYAPLHGAARRLGASRAVRARRERIERGAGVLAGRRQPRVRAARRLAARDLRRRGRAAGSPAASPPAARRPGPTTRRPRGRPTATASRSRASAARGRPRSTSSRADGAGLRRLDARGASTRRRRRGRRTARNSSSRATRRRTPAGRPTSSRSARTAAP